MQKPTVLSRLRPPLALSILAVALTGCAFSTQFTGSARVEGGRQGCEMKCSQWGMELDAMVAIGEYSDACVCRKREAQAAPPAPPAAAPPGAVPPPTAPPAAAPPAPAPTGRSAASTAAVVAAAAGVSSQMDREQTSRHDASPFPR